MFSEWLQDQGLLFWVAVFVVPLYVAWIFHMVYYNIGYARSCGNFDANMRNERKFIAFQEEKLKKGLSLHSPECEHHPQHQNQFAP